MFDTRFKGKICVPSKDALKDMAKHNVSPSMLKGIIEEGNDYKNSRMKKDEMGRSIDQRKSTIFVKLVPSYSYSLDEEVWLIKHVGIKRRDK